MERRDVDTPMMPGNYIYEIHHASPLYVSTDEKASAQHSDLLCDVAVVAATTVTKAALMSAFEHKPDLRCATEIGFSAWRAYKGDLAGAGIEASAAAAPLVFGKGNAASHVTEMFETALLVKDLLYVFLK